VIFASNQTFWTPKNPPSKFWAGYATDPAFLFQTRIWSEKFVKKWTQSWRHLLFLAVPGVCVFFYACHS